jgi:hypothetical protein
MTINDVAQQLNMKWQTVSELVRLGFLSKRDGGVVREAVISFRTNFISGADLARAEGIRPRSLMKIMSEARIRPATAPPLCRQTFYPRVAVSNSSQLRSRHPSICAAACRSAG